MFALLLLSDAQSAGAASDSPGQHASTSVFPVIMYDSDIGLGLGVKGVVKNSCRKKESFDLTLFGSTRGEQWYVIAVSLPDAEIRQGTPYPIAVDFNLEFDKRLKSNYFGIGNDSQDNEHQFPREFYKIKALASHAFGTDFTGTLGFRIAHYSAYGYKPEWQTINDQTPGAGESDLSAAIASFRYDTRDSWIDPHRGLKIEISVEQALKAISKEWDFSKVRLESSIYQMLFDKNNVVAFRWWMQDVRGRVPYQELSKVGDGWTARGYKADRFLDRSMALTSAEYRVRIYKKLGGVLFADVGRVGTSFDKPSLNRWHSDWGGGLRYYLANFVARFDVGTSKEGTRLFVNFGQVF